MVLELPLNLRVWEEGSDEGDGGGGGEAAGVDDEEDLHHGVVTVHAASL